MVCLTTFKGSLEKVLDNSWLQVYIHTIALNKMDTSSFINNGDEMKVGSGTSEVNHSSTTVIVGGIIG